MVVAKLYETHGQESPHLAWLPPPGLSHLGKGLTLAKPMGPTKDLPTVYRPVTRLGALSNMSYRPKRMTGLGPLCDMLIVQLRRACCFYGCHHLLALW